MIIRVVPDVRVIFGAPTNDNALRPTVVQAGCVHGEAAVIAVALVRQYLLVVAEVPAVLTWIGIGGAGEDVIDDGFGFIRQGVYCTGFKAGGSHCLNLT